MNKLIIWVAGRNCQAAKLFGSICQEYGNLTLGELSKKLSMNSYRIIWRAEQ